MSTPDKKTNTLVDSRNSRLPSASHFQSYQLPATNHPHASGSVSPIAALSDHDKQQARDQSMNHMMSAGI